jgi:two-component system, NarL family, response regulator DesR
MVALLGPEPDIEVVAKAAGGEEMLALARKHEPDVAMLDIEIPRRRRPDRQGEGLAVTG